MSQDLAGFTGVGGSDFGAGGGRHALAAVATQFWINGMIYAAIVPRLPDIRNRFSLDVSDLGLILTLAAIGGLLGSALGGPAVVRYGTKRCIIVGSVLTVMILPLVGLTTSVVLLVVFLGLLSLLDVVVDIGMNIQGSRISGTRTTPVINRLHGLWSLGTVIGGLISVRAAAAGVSLLAHLIGVAVVLAATLAVSGRYLLSVDEPATDDRDSGGAADTTASDTVLAADATSPGTENQQALYPSSSVFGRTMLFGLLGGAAVTMEITTSDWAAFRLADDLAVDPGRVGLGFVAFTSGMVTGRFAGDLALSKLGSRLLVRYASVLAAIGLLIGTVLPVGWYDGVPLLSPLVVTIAGFYIAALGVSVIFPQLYDAAAKAPGPAGQGLAALTAGTRVAGLSAPVIVGFVADTSLAVGTAVALVTVPCCLISFLVPLSRDGRGVQATTAH